MSLQTEAYISNISVAVLTFKSERVKDKERERERERERALGGYDITIQYVLIVSIILLTASSAVA
jgi:hypothetical protein